MQNSTIRDLVTQRNSALDFSQGSSKPKELVSNGNVSAENHAKLLAGEVPSSGRCTCVRELVKRISALRRLSHTNDGDFAVVNNNDVKWAKLFMEFILGTAFCQATKCQAHSDDMIWYVQHQRMTNSFYIGQSFTTQLQVFRRQSKNQPTPADSNYNWEESVCINLILQQLDFFVTCAVCTKPGPQNLQILKKNCQRVYPSPSRRRMDSKGESEEITYPRLYFAIDGFEEVFNDVVVRDGECVCVELVARDRDRSREAVIFLGSIRYEILKQVYDTKLYFICIIFWASSTWHWAQKLIKQGDRRQEFVRMRGPQGKGYAEMAVARVPNCGYETPSTENPIDFSELAGMEQTLKTRRMSENNLAGPVLVGRGVGGTMGGSHSARGRRWQSEADTVNQYPEVEGNNIDDELEEGVMSRLWSVKGFGQAWHWLREKKRAECTPLNAYLTYVTLPWTSILQDFLTDHPKSPILTFEFNDCPSLQK